jgi:N-acetylgalactosamine kinase
VVDEKEFGQALQDAGPLANTLEDFFTACYGKHADIRYERARYSAGLARFSEAFPNSKRLAISRAPGRINLIGEPNDYNRLPVLTMAIERDVVVIFSPRKDRRINLINTSFWFPPRSFDISGRIRPYAPGNWGNFAKAAAQTLQQSSDRQLRGMDACIMGDIPSSSGLSSSSVLVAATVMALAAVNNLPLDSKDMAELLALGERYPGIEGSSADPAMSFLIEPKKASKIDFCPLCATSVVLPEDYSIVVCNSLVSPERSGAAREEFRRRVIECRIGAMLLSKLTANQFDSRRQSATLVSLRNLPAEKETEVIDALPDGGILIRDLAKMLGMSQPRFKENIVRLAGMDELHEPKDGFKIKKRVRHVLTEARRVERSALALGVGDIQRFGDLMSQSHESCANDYEISTPEIDRLTEICREEGALGARLIGPGFGGCAIALVHDRDVPDFMTTIIGRYYNDYLLSERSKSPMSTMSLENAIFPCKPSSGTATLV